MIVPMEAIGATRLICRVSRYTTIVHTDKHDYCKYQSKPTCHLIQAFNVTGSRLPGDDWHVTMAWLLKQTTRDPAIRNIEIAAQVLLAISGRTLLSIRNFTGIMQ